MSWDAFRTPLWLLASGLLLSFSTQGQQLPLRYYGQQDGLANMSVTALAQDSPGYLWAGTENGLFRFDGARFREFGETEGLEPAPAVNALLLDRESRLWAATQNAVYVLEGGRFTPVPTSDGKPLPASGGFRHLAELPAAGVIFISKEHIFLARRKSGAAAWTAAPFFSEDQQRAVPDLEHVNSLAVARDGTLWLTTRRDQSRVYRIRQQEITAFGTQQGVPPGEYLGGIAEDEAGNIWLRSANKLLRLEPGGGTFADLTGNLAQARILQVYFPLAWDGDGRLLGASNEGLFRGREGRWQVFGKAQGLASGGGVNALLADRSGDLWLALAGHGLAHWKGYPHWVNWTSGQGLPSDDVWSFLHSSDGSMLFGTGEGIAVLPDGASQAKALDTAGKGANGQVSTMVESAQGTLWAGTFGGYLLQRKRGASTISVAARLPSILNLSFDHRQRLWIGTTEGLYLLENPEGDQQPRQYAGLAQVAGKEKASVRGACSTADGVSWLLADGHLLRLDGERWLLAWQPQSGVSAPDDLSCGQRELWLLDGASSQAWRSGQLQAGRKVAMAPFDATPAPLKGRQVHSLMLDRRGWLWLGSDSGVAVWNGRRWRVFDQQSGLVWNDTNQYALREDPRDGSIWIGTSSGASHLENPQALFELPPLAVYLDAMRFNGKERAPVPGMELPWNGGALEFTLASPSSINRDALHFRYRLKGLEEEWSTTGSGMLRYAALPPGAYTLQAAASNEMLQSVSPLMELPFRVAPPWWRSLWFYAATALAAAVVLAALFRWRMRIILRRQRELDQLVKVRTAELEASREEHRMRALLDGLTQAWNRGAMMERISQRLAALELGGETFVLILLDLDYFKKINDTHGHLAGDAVLKEVVRRLQASLRASDAVGRYGGEEFIVLLPDLDAARGRQRIAALQRVVGDDPVQLPDGPAITVTCSFGVAVAAPGRRQSPESLLKDADAALYRAKANGRNRVEYAGSEPPMPAGR